MKRLTSFILVLAISIFGNSFACGPYWPYGDDLRFSLLNPRNFKFTNLDCFYYTAYQTSYEYLRDTVYKNPDENILLWKKRCKNIPLTDDIVEAIYELDDSLHYSINSNSFARYLFQHKDKAAIDYINFAKNCSKYNQTMDDPWERDDEAKIPMREYLTQQALQKAKTTADKDIRSRYAFLAIRLAYYNGNAAQIRTIYETWFAKTTTKNIIYYWALYFKTLVQPTGALRNYESALIFSNAPDKRFMIAFQYDKSIPLAKTVAFAKNARERAAIYLLNGIKNYGHGLTEIQSLYKCDPHNEGLSFLLLREVNKLEDWILTPYYTNYPPSLFEEMSRPAMNRRILRDKAYLNDVLSFLNEIDLDKVKNPLSIKTAKTYLTYMSGEYDKCLSELNSINKSTRDSKLKNQLNIIQALCILGKQQKYKATLTDFIKNELLVQYKNRNRKFIFAIARELEYKGNTRDAAFLLSTLPQDFTDEEPKTVYWTKKVKTNNWGEDYYTDYFSYIDEQYNPAEVQAMISEIENNHFTDRFTIWKLHFIKTDLQKLYDLLGTKYMRLNNLKAALTAYENVSDTFWLSGNNYYTDYLDANPFYTNLYTEHARTKADTITFTKTTLVKKLSEYLSKAEDVHNSNRDYYYFLVANCYFNMTQYGNSWMMKRYYWSTNGVETLMPDNKEYFHCNYAKQYYLKAKEVSKNKKFSALCLRMAARCEFYKITYNNGNWDGEGKNSYYAQLKKQYPNYYDDLVSNCESFDAYFKARR
jgi:hypothetical protein